MAKEITSRRLIDGIFIRKRIKPKRFWRPKRKKIPFWFSWSPTLFILTVTFFLFVLAFGFSKLSNSQNVQAKFELANFLANGKFLVLFLNQTELRGSGGFIGSYADVVVKNGKIEDFNFDTNIYTSDKKLAERLKVAPPLPIKKYLELDNWYMRDSNWALDFTEAAPAIAWFDLQKRGLKNNDLDGVIAIDAKVFTDYLKIKGPVKLSDGTIVNDQNFLSLIQYKVEKEYYADPKNWDENQPKKILKELFADLTKNLGSGLLSDGAIRKIVSQNLAEKHLVFYSFNPDTELEIKKLNWGGSIRNDEISNGLKSDFLMVSNTNLGGKKSSANVKENVKYVKNGDQITLTIQRKHIGSYNWPDGENRNYLRVLVPLNSELKSAELENKNIINQIDKSKEANKTELGFWLPLLPGESKTLKLVYTLPKTIDGDKLLVQKQIGSMNEELEIIQNNQPIYKGLLNKDLEF